VVWTFSAVSFPLLALPFRDCPVTLSYATTVQVISQPLNKEKSYNGSNNRRYHPEVPEPMEHAPEDVFGVPNVGRFRRLRCRTFFAGASPVLIQQAPGGAASTGSGVIETEHIPVAL